MFSSAVVVALSLATSVSAHGYLRYIDHKGITYGAWQVFSDPYLTPLPLRYDRSYRDNGPIVDFTGTNVTCNNGPNDGANVGFINVSAGDKVKLVWDQWNSAHSGPVMTYMAKCAGGCATFKGDTGSPWFKIDQFGYDASKTPPWGSDYLHSQGDWWEVTIPPTLSSGEYLLRHEILGLHVAGTLNGAQFYPSCVHLRVTGSGSASPGNVALPGAYSPNDPGILAELWRFNQGQQIYTAPGGAVWSGAVQEGQTVAKPTFSTYKALTFAPSVRGESQVPVSTTRVQTTSAAATTSTAGTTRVVTSTTRLVSSTTTTTARAVTTTSATGGLNASLYGQCGGKGWTGATVCAQGTCKVSNEFYSQCLP